MVLQSVTAKYPPLSWVIPCSFAEHNFFKIKQKCLSTFSHHRGLQFIWWTVISLREFEESFFTNYWSSIAWFILTNNRMLMIAWGELLNSQFYLCRLKSYTIVNNGVVGRKWNHRITIWTFGIGPGFTKQTRYNSIRYFITHSPHDCRNTVSPFDYHWDSQEDKVSTSSMREVSKNWPCMWGEKGTMWIRHIKSVDMQKFVHVRT